MENKKYGTIGFRFIEDIERPGEEILKKLEPFSAANLSDGMNKFYTMDSGISQMFPSAKMIGPAITVKVRSGDNLMLHKAIGLAKKGDVIVVETQHCNGYALMGELMGTSMAKVGVAGVVIDGTVRDLKDLTEIAMPVYARGTVCGAGDKDGPGEVNYPICCGGVVVNPGDIIVGDEDGVVVIPKDDILEVIEKTQKKTGYEEKRRIEIQEGKVIKKDINEILRIKGVIE